MRDGKKSKKLKAVIFDMDGVIIDSIPVHFKAWQELFAKYEKKNYKFEEFEKVIGFSTENIIIKFKNEYNIKEDVEKMAQVKNDLYLKYFKKEARLVSGVLPLLKQLKKRRLSVALASSEPTPIIKTVILKFRLKDFFKVIIGGDETIRPKPSPEIFLKAASELKVSPSECLVIEDSPPGITAAKSAKMKCLAIATTHKHTDLKRADFIINKFSELNLDDFQV